MTLALRPILRFENDLHLLYRLLARGGPQVLNQRRVPGVPRPDHLRDPGLDLIQVHIPCTVLLGGDKSPDSISGPLLDEIAAVIPSSEVVVLPGLGHLAPQDEHDGVASAIFAHRAR